MSDLELTDTQIALIIKAALDFNAGVINYASQIYKQDIKPQDRKRMAKDFRMYVRDYNKQVEAIVAKT